MKKKLLVVSRHHKLTGKGYAITLNNIYKTGLLQQDYEIHQLSWHKFDGDELSDNGIFTYGVTEEDQFGISRLKELWEGLQPDITLFHADPFFFLPYQEIIPLWKGRIVGWFTIDNERVPVQWQKLMKMLSVNGSLSEFGKNKIAEATGKEAFKVKLGVDHSIFKPVDETQKVLKKTQLGLDKDAVLILVVGVNTWRKGLELSLKTFETLHHDYPDTGNIYLYLHTDIDKELHEMIMSMAFKDKIIFSRNYDPINNPYPVDEMVSLYQAADFLFSSSMGEGFGMTFLEAAACGTPSLAPDNSSIGEVVGEGGILYPAPGFIAARNNGVALLRVPDTVTAAREVYKLCKDREKIRQLAEKAYRQSVSETWTKTAAELKSLFDDIIDKNPGKPEMVYSEPKLTKV